MYNLLPPASRVNNLVVGRLWIDTFGEMRVNNLKTGASAVLTFKECNMFGAGRWEVSGDVLGADGECKLKLKGKWNESMTATQPDGSSGRILWAKNPDPKEGALVEKYGFDNWTLRMNAAKDAPKGLLKSDSRLRPDRMALEKGDDTTAQKMKHVLEEKQRAGAKEKGGKWRGVEATVVQARGGGRPSRARAGRRHGRVGMERSVQRGVGEKDGEGD